MPLRDHFRPPLDDRRHWSGMYGGWPMMIVASLRQKLPRGFYAEPRVHTGKSAELDVASFEQEAESVYEVLVFDERRRSRLVAAVELISPGNKERPENRNVFMAKCAGLLRERVSVVIVDIVTTQNQNLYGELMEMVGRSDADVGSAPLYAAACRCTKSGDEWRLEAWAHSLSLGRPLPTVPLWLADDLAVPLELEKSYEESCSILGIRQPWPAQTQPCSQKRMNDFISVLFRAANGVSLCVSRL